MGESKRKGGLYRRNTKNENIEKNAKISIDALQNESEESNEIKFQNKIIRCILLVIHCNYLVNFRFGDYFKKLC